MQMPQIRLQSTYAKIGIETKNASLQIEQPNADLDIQQPKAEMTIHRTPSKLSIDQTAAWEAMGIKSTGKSVAENAQIGKQAWMDGIARRVQEGNELMQIENGGSPIAAHAEKNGKRPEKHFNIGFIPPHGSVKLAYEPAKIDIDWQTNQVINNTKTNKPITEYEPGAVSVTTLQNNDLNIDFVHVNFKEEG